MSEKLKHWIWFLLLVVGMSTAYFWGTINETARLTEAYMYKANTIEKIRYIENEYKRQVIESELKEFPNEISIPKSMAELPSADVFYIPLKNNEYGGYTIEIGYPEPTFWSKTFGFDDESTLTRSLRFKEHKS